MFNIYKNILTKWLVSHLFWETDDWILGDLSREKKLRDTTEKKENKEMSLSEMTDYINSNNINLSEEKDKKIAKDFLNELKKKHNSSKLENDDISSWFLGFWGWEKKAVEKILSLIEPTKQLKEWQNKVKEITQADLELLEKWISDTNHVTYETRKNLNQAKNQHSEKKLENSYETTKTKEQIWEIQSNFGRWSLDRQKVVDWFWAETKSSLASILKSPKLSQIAEELKKVAPTTFVDYKLWDNYSWFRNVLEKYGYKKDWIFDDREAWAVYQTVLDYVNNQNKILSLTPEQQLQLLLDFDKDWNLGKKANFSVWEAQQYYLVMKWLSSDWINAFIENLWFSNMTSFSKEMSKNLYGARERFQRVLWSLIERKVNPSELVMKNWVKKSLDSIYMENNQTRLLESQIDSDDELNKKLSTLNDVALAKEIKRIIKLEAVWILLWAKNWLWASFNVKDFTRWFIDSLQFWILNDWKFWISFSKNLFEDKFKNTWFSMWVSFSNFCIPVFGATYTFEDKKELKELFADKIQGTYEPSVYAWISTAWNVIWVSVSKVDIWTEKGIENAVDSMKSYLEMIKKDLKDWKDFNNSSYYTKSTDKSNDEVVYNELKQAYNLFKWEKYSEQALNDMMNGYLNYYRNYLYTNAQWIRLTSLWIWVLLVSWFLPLPYLTAWWEKISQKWHEVNNRVNSVISNTEKARTFDEMHQKYKLTIERYNWHDVYAIPDIKNYSISSDTWLVQAERDWTMIYFSWKITSIWIVETTYNDWIWYTLVINWWKLDKNWAYIQAQEEKINSSFIKTETKTVAKKVDEIITTPLEPLHTNSEKLIKSNLEKIQQAMPLMTELSKHIDRRAIDDPKNTTIPKLRDLILSYLNEISFSSGRISKKWKAATLDDAWNYLWSLLKTKWNSYLKKEIGKKEIWNVIEAYNSINDDEVKSIVLQSIYSNTMQDIYVENKIISDGEYEKNIKKLEKAVLPEFVKKVSTLKTKIDWQNAVNKISWNWDIATAKRAYLFAMMPIEIFDTINIWWVWTRTNAFSKRIREYWIKDINLDSARSEMYKSIWKEKSLESSYYTESRLIAFPVASQVDTDKSDKINRAYKWITPITWAIEVGKWSMVELKENSNDLVNKLPESVLTKMMEAINKVVPANKQISDTNQVKEYIKWNSKIEWLTISYKTVFFKWWACLNDALWIKDLSLAYVSKETGKVTKAEVVTNTTWDVEVRLYDASVSTINVAENEITKFGIAAAWKQQESTNNNNNSWSGWIQGWWDSATPTPPPDTNLWEE